MWRKTSFPISRVFQSCNCGKCTSRSPLGVFRACACDEFKSFPVSRNRASSSLSSPKQRDTLKSATFMFSCVSGTRNDTEVIIVSRMGLAATLPMHKPCASTRNRVSVHMALSSTTSKPFESQSTDCCSFRGDKLLVGTTSHVSRVVGATSHWTQNSLVIKSPKHIYINMSERHQTIVVST